MTKIINKRTFYQVVMDLETLGKHQTINDFNKTIVIDGEIYTMYKILGVNKTQVALMVTKDDWE